MCSQKTSVERSYPGPRAGGGAGAGQEGEAGGPGILLLRRCSLRAVPTGPERKQTGWGGVGWLGWGWVGAPRRWPDARTTRRMAGGAHSHSRAQNVGRARQHPSPAPAQRFRPRSEKARQSTRSCLPPWVSIDVPEHRHFPNCNMSAQAQGTGPALSVDQSAATAQLPVGPLTPFL